jgi:hypothetical protein
MSCSYRLCKKSTVSPAQSSEKIVEYSIRKIRFNNHGEITSCTLASYQLSQVKYASNSTEQKFIDQFRLDLKRMLECLDKEVIDFDKLDRISKEKED